MTGILTSPVINRFRQTIRILTGQLMKLEVLGKAHMVANGRTRLAVPEMKDVLRIQIERMLQFLFDDTPTYESFVKTHSTQSFPRTQTRSDMVQLPDGKQHLNNVNFVKEHIDLQYIFHFVHT